MSTSTGQVNLTDPAGRQLRKRSKTTVGYNVHDAATDSCTCLQGRNRPRGNFRVEKRRRMMED